MEKSIMTPEERKTFFARYREGVHRMGRAWTVAALLAWGVNKMFFQFWSEIFAELVENAENFY